MWDRKDLKAKGKAAYRANRVTCIIAALILSIALGTSGSGASMGASGAGNIIGSQNAYNSRV